MLLMKYLALAKCKLKSIWRFRGKSKASVLELMIESEQRSAWEESGLQGRLYDAAYPFSGNYDPPEEVENDIASIIMMTGVAVGRPIVTKEPLTSVYQEKLTFPILVSCWDRLVYAGLISEKLRATVLIATVPSGNLYPKVHFDDRSDNKAIIYNANLLFTLIAAASLLSKLCASPGAKRAETVGCWVEGYSVARPVSSFLSHLEEISSFTSVLATLVRYGHPFVPGNKYLIGGTFVPRLVVDFYTFMLAHEIGHIQHGHSGPSSSTAGSGGTAFQEDEFLADVEGFAHYANATEHEFGGNFGSYVHVSFCFYIMGLIYRTVNYFQGNKDYAFWTPEQMWKLYFPRPETKQYLHPLGRLQLLRGEVRKRAVSSSAELDKWDGFIHKFFDSLWRGILQNLVLHEQGSIHPIWAQLKIHHESCINQEGD